ncbi:MAG: hypothetical protein RXP28_05320 [Nitrososphaeria archaeon]
MKNKKILAILLIVLITSSCYIYFSEYTSKSPYGHTYTYLIKRDFGFNGKFINFSEYMEYKFGYPYKGLLNITVTEPEQQYIVTIFLNNYTVKSVVYIYNTSISLNANEGERENIYLPFISNSNLTTINLLSYNFSNYGISVITIPAFGKIKTVHLGYRGTGKIGPSNYNLSINYFYSLNGLLVMSQYIWSSSGPTGEYYRNITSILIKG